MIVQFKQLKQQKAITPSICSTLSVLGTLQHSKRDSSDVRVAIATFNGPGSPVVEFTLTGGNGTPHKLRGIIDTGFSGFVLLPLVQFVKLGLALEGTSEFGLVDGQLQTKAFGMGTVDLEGRQAKGQVFLDMTGPHILLGMPFLRQLELALVVRDTECDLYDETWLSKHLAEPPITISSSVSAVKEPLKIPKIVENAIVEEVSLLHEEVSLVTQKPIQQ